MQTTYSFKSILGITAIALAGGLMLTSTAAQARGPGGGHERLSFEQLDTNGDGQITMAEMEARGAARFAATDTNNDGKLSKEELTAAGSERMAKRVDRMLERLDADGDGALSQAELEDGRKGKGRGDRMEKRFERMDADGSGGISAEEFEAHAGKGKGRKGGKGGGDR